MSTHEITRRQMLAGCAAALAATRLPASGGGSPQDAIAIRGLEAIPPYMRGQITRFAAAVCAPFQSRWVIDCEVITLPRPPSWGPYPLLVLKPMCEVGLPGRMLTLACWPGVRVEECIEDQVAQSRLVMAEGLLFPARDGQIPTASEWDAVRRFLAKLESEMT